MTDIGYKCEICGHVTKFVQWTFPSSFYKGNIKVCGPCLGKLWKLAKGGRHRMLMKIYKRNPELIKIFILSGE